MRTRFPIIIGVVVMLHGLLHLLGAAKGLGWFTVSALTQPIGSATGAVWLPAGVVVVLAGVLLVRMARGWWLVGAAAAVVSQAVILTSWADAMAGTVVNVLLLVAAGYGFAAQGPRSYRAEYQRRVDSTLAGSIQVDVISEADLAGLPVPVADYLHRCGVVGQPRVVNFRACIHGRIRAAATAPWMSFTGEQVNTYGPSASRLFRMDATMFGLPVDVLHVLVAGSASMRVKLCSLLPMVAAAGPEMDLSETVTLLNDLCVLAPAGLVDAPISWQGLDARHVRATLMQGVHTVSAELVFNDDHDLVDFVCDDRQRSSADGRTFTPQRWSTPIGRYRTVGGRRCATNGEGHWHAPEPEGEFAYLEFAIDEIAYNVDPGRDLALAPVQHARTGQAA